MTGDQWLVIAILAVALVAFISDRIRVDVVAIGVLLACALTGLLTTEEAFAGFSNPAVITVLAVFIVSGTLVETGVADRIARLVLASAGRRFGSVVAVLMITCGLMSAFMNNIGATAILLPAALVIAERTDIPASKLLMPLAFASLLGGNITAIGTPPNILANGILATQTDLSPFDFFDFAPTGLILLAAGVAYMVAVGDRLLPSRGRTGRFDDDLRLADYISTVRIGPESDLVGRTLDELQLGRDLGIRVLAIEQDGQGEPTTPLPTSRIGARDRLVVQASLSSLAAFKKQYGAGAAVEPTAVEWLDASRRAERGAPSTELAELMVAPGAGIIGSSLASLELAQRGLVALAVRFRGRIRTRLAGVELRAGDSLVVTGDPAAIASLVATGDFVTLQVPDISTRATERAPFALIVLGVALALAAFGTVSISVSLLTAAMVMVVSGTVTMEQAYQFVEWPAIFLIAGMLPMGTALEDTGTAQLIADKLVALLGGMGPLWVLVGLYLLTAAITSVIANAAATVLLVPIAIDAAVTLEASPRPFVMATVIAASTAFIAPTGHQVNVLVYGPGHYRFGDFAKVGLGLTALIAVLVALIVPVLWPL